MNHRIVSREEWLAARKQLMLKEKEFTHARESLSRERRELPWVRVDKPYVFQGAEGAVTLSELFQGRSQLVVYHFMFAPEWETACKSCSFWADSFNGIVPHLAQRDVSFVAISRAPFAKLQEFERRMGWSFRWVSSGGTDFNFDYFVSFTPEELAAQRSTYNYGPNGLSKSDLPGISAFYKDERGDVFHTYSCYARGIDMMNTAYQYLDLTPKGRDEQALPYPMAWVKLHDEYR
ncbi:DUF899 domain-containing protein [Pyxidicoccus parkwayensis]|jgi:predicted dithiol-disulfide oxidoreductase (DUF899 family)|uniref:DUF899 domain-containing protein n=1 Tax=Pyxidicoccus parkwayensis TaxID=2813578 RepID=A0ABX7NWU8_9BACT|nr:thioredoxin family protein [Pyxidicoccus parkwaysis]QSQ21874.1 DUF899 domain-containing protein [Pyxidicoccus parkwaysis]